MSEKLPVKCDNCGLSGKEFWPKKEFGQMIALMDFERKLIFCSPECQKNYELKEKANR